VPPALPVVVVAVGDDEVVLVGAGGFVMVVTGLLGLGPLQLKTGGPVGGTY
jgi:hypothetical protein